MSLAGDLETLREAIEAERVTHGASLRDLAALERVMTIVAEIKGIQDRLAALEQSANPQRVT